VKAAKGNIGRLVDQPDATVRFFNLLGLEEVRRMESEKGRFTLIFMAAPGQKDVAEVELTYNWPPADGSAPEAYGGGRNFGGRVSGSGALQVGIVAMRFSTRISTRWAPAAGLPPRARFVIVTAGRSAHNVRAAAAGD